MEQTLGNRIKELKIVYSLDREQFSCCCGLSYLTIFNLEKGKINRPQSHTVKKIANTFGTSAEWLLYGKGEMLPHGIKDLDAEEEPISPKDKVSHTTYVELKLKNDLLEKELDRLWKVVAFVFEKEAPGSELLKKRAV